MTTSPIQRLLHRSTTRSSIPQLDCGRTDDKPNRTEKERTLRRTQYHYKHARLLPPIKQGSPVLIRDFTSHKQNWKDAQVLKQLCDRPYSVVSQGQVLRRNCKHLLTQDTVMYDDVDNPITTDDPLNQVQSVPVDNQGTNADSSVQSIDDVTQIVTTRSGCMIRPPKWQKDSL